jgi:hypothetical protein
MKFARIVFLVAGIYGLIVMLPLYFMEARTGRDYPPPITHPEYYYGFIGVGVAWQLAFLLISRDPLRYRPLMIPFVVEKASFGIAVALLYMQGRVSSFMLGAAMADSVLGVLFVLAFLMTARTNSGVKIFSAGVDLDDPGAS